MSAYLKFCRNAAVFCAVLSGPPAADAAFVIASSDMQITGLGLRVDDANAQVEWVAVPPATVPTWYGETRAHAADSESAPQDGYDDYLGNNGSAQAQANTAHVSSLANYGVSGGEQTGNPPAVSITGTTHSDLHLEFCNMQADGFAITNYDNFFQITSSSPNPSGSVNIAITLDYSGVIFGSADKQGYFVDITHIATMRLFGPDGTNPLALLSYDSYFDSISGNNTTIQHTANGSLLINYALAYNTLYQLSNEVDSEIYGYTPTPATLPMFLLGLAVMRKFRRQQA